MKSIVMPVTEELNKNENEQPVTESKENETKETKSTKQKFTAVDMWNRQRSSRSASDRIRRWNLN